MMLKSNSDEGETLRRLRVTHRRLCELVPCPRYSTAIAVGPKGSPRSDIEALLREPPILHGFRHTLPPLHATGGIGRHVMVLQ
jgi:hypothetical protein